jgi:hypothetical protein
MMGTSPQKPAQYLVNAVNKMHEMLEEYERSRDDPKAATRSLRIAAKMGCRALTQYVDDVRRGPEGSSLILPIEYLQKRAIQFVLASDSETFFEAERQILLKAGMAESVIERLIKWCREGLEEVRAGKSLSEGSDRSPSGGFIDPLEVLKNEACENSRVLSKHQTQLDRDLKTGASNIFAPRSAARADKSFKARLAKAALRTRLRVYHRTQWRVFRGISGAALRSVNEALQIAAPGVAPPAAGRLTAHGLLAQEQWVEVVLGAFAWASKSFGDWVVGTSRKN